MQRRWLIDTSVIIFGQQWRPVAQTKKMDRALEGLIHCCFYGICWSEGSIIDVKVSSPKSNVAKGIQQAK